MIQVILGRRGSGKTTLCKELLRKSRCNFLIFDPMMEYEDMARAWPDARAFLSELALRQAWDRDTLQIEADALPQISELVYRSGHVLYVVEECDLICSPVSIEPWFSRLIRHGRHKDVDLLCVSRRPAEISRHLTGNADEIYVSRFVEPRDREYLSSLGISLDQVDSLGRWEFLRFDVVSATSEKIN